MRLLVTGGSGYVGSPVVHELKKFGHDIIVYDNFVYGHRQSLPKDVSVIEGDLLQKETLADLFETFLPEAVLHFASYTYVGESVENPEKYFENNVVGSLNLLSIMRRYDVKRIVFSSSAAVYGEPEKIPISEDHPLNPTSPYGETKLIIEKMLKSFDVAYGIKYISLRYFNAAGADLENDIGEDHDPETHLIPLVIKTALGKRSEIKIFGTDYQTPDGTCIRDYIHIKDLASAHILALEKLNSVGQSRIYNLGTGKGASVREVINIVKKISGKNFKVVETSRRPGDPAQLVASNELAKKELGWVLRYSDIETIILDAWKWHSKHPDGYK